MLLEKVTQETHDDETSRKSALDTHLENATRLLNGMMQALHHQTSALKDEEEVTNALTQDHQGLIMKTIANMVQTSVEGEVAQNLFNGIYSMAICQWRIQHEALMTLSPQKGPSSMLYNNNSGDTSPPQGQPPSMISNNDVMRLLAEQQKQSSDMMMRMMSQMTTNNAKQLEIQQADEDRKKEQYDLKTGIANRISLMSKCLQPQNFKDFTKHPIGEVPVTKLMKFMDGVMSFLETVEPQSARVNTYIRKLHGCTFTRGMETEPQSVALSAEENYLNIRACHTKEKDRDPPALENFSQRERKIDVQAYYWFKTLFDSNSPEIKQFESRIKSQPELATYTELALYLFQTRSRSPVVTWGHLAQNLDLVESKLITDYQGQPIAAVKERLQEFIEEYNNVQLLPWQVLVSKIYRYAVKANSKRSVEWIDREVLAFLSHATDGETL